MSSLKKYLYNFERLLYSYYKIFTIFPVVYKTRSFFSISKSIHVAAQNFHTFLWLSTILYVFVYKCEYK